MAHNSTRLAARLKAYDWFCRRYGFCETDFEPGYLDEAAVRQQEAAWAWARENWAAFLSQASDEEAQFLRDLFATAAGPKGGWRLRT